MAARRLIALLLVLLFLSSLAAALAPVQEGMRSESSTDSESTTTAEPALPESGTAEEGRLITQTVAASGEPPPAVRVRVGDRLRLTVTSKRSGTIELQDLGQAEDVGPAQPAFFDVLLRDEGTFPVRFISTGREVARIEVSHPRMAPASR